MTFVESVKTGLKNRSEAYRNPVYLLYGLLGLAMFMFGAIIAESGVGAIETYIFLVFNGLGDWLNELMILFSLPGTIGMAVVVSLIALLRKHYANSIKVLLASVLAYSSAYWLKLNDIRQRPEQLLENSAVREISDGTLGYPSGHMAVATVLALTAYIYIPKKFHKYITFLLIMVGVSRMYLGVHFPIDLMGGWAIGLFFAGILNFIFGSRSYDPVPTSVIKEKLTEYGYSVSRVVVASVDARGSTPYFVTMKDKSKYFFKIVGFENNVADWLFKISRRIMYRRLEDEQPFMSPKRQLEHEAYVAMKAKIAGVNTPNILGVFETLPGRWGMAQEMIDGKSLDGVNPKDITPKVLENIWKQVNILHESRIVHRDLRAANVFLSSKGEPALIDFGFSEASATDRLMLRDVVELLASLSLLVGVDKSVNSALKSVDHSKLKEALPYLSYATLSGATTTGLKKNKGMLDNLINTLKEKLDVHSVKTKQLKRFTLKTLLIIVFVGVALHALTPQLGSFNDSVDSAKDARLDLLVVALALSFTTYLFSALAYQFLSIYPLKFRSTLLVQLASSFASKLGPAGTGGMALNIRYLTKNQHTALQAGTVTATNTILGLAGHLSVLLIVALVTHQSLETIEPNIHIPSFVFIILVLSAMTLLIASFIFKNIKSLIRGGISKVIKNISYYKNNKNQVALGYLSSIAITLGYALTLFVCAEAMGVDLSVLDVIYVFTVGAIAATVTPTPGGLGGVEAALVASMTHIGVSSGDALAITLVYRLLTFWLPIIPGFISFRYSLKKEYI